MMRSLRSGSLLVLLVCAASAALLAQDITFATPKQIAVSLPDSAGVIHYSAADFDNDGRMDYLLEPWNQGDLLDFALLLGNGYGSFTQEQTNVPVPAGATGPAPQYVVADVNNDGKADIITFQPGCESNTPCQNESEQSNPTGFVKVYLNEGDGRFLPTYTGTLPQLGTINYAVADFNGDKLPDIAVLATNYSSDATGHAPVLTVFLNQGDGLFTQQNDTNLPAAMASFPIYMGNLVAGDFTGNGREDLLFSYVSAPGGPTPTGVVYRLPNNGKGSFGPPVQEDQFSSGGAHIFIAGDVNGDARTDLVSGRAASQSVTVLLANPTGSFSVSPALHYYIPFLFQTAFADLDGDGKQDLVFSGTTSAGAATAAAYMGYGNGTFNTSYKAFHPSGPWNTDLMAIAPLVKGQLPSIMFQTGSNTFELYVSNTKK